MSNIGDDVDASVFDGTPMVQTQCNSASELMESGYQSGTVGEEVAALSLSVEEQGSLTEIEELKYDMLPSRKRGRLLLFCNRTFERLPERLGSDKDVEAIQDVFSRILKFDVVTYYDKSAIEMYFAIKQECSDDVDHVQEDCFAVFILSHGDANGVVFGGGSSVVNEKPNQTTINKLAEPVQQCKTLVGKPKLFFIQACRGKKLNESLSIHSDGKEATSGLNMLPETADFLFAYSTVEGYCSFRNKSLGSWFIQTLCAQFKDNWQKLEIMQMLTRVCRQMSTLMSRVSNNEGMNCRQQVSSVTTSLTKALYFMPKL